MHRFCSLGSKAKQILLISKTNVLLCSMGCLSGFYMMIYNDATYDNLNTTIVYKHSYEQRHAFFVVLNVSSMKMIRFYSKLTEILQIKNRNTYKIFTSFLTVCSCNWAHSMCDYLKNFTSFINIASPRISVTVKEINTHTLKYLKIIILHVSIIMFTEDNVSQSSSLKT